MIQLGLFRVFSFSGNIPPKLWQLGLLIVSLQRRVIFFIIMTAKEDREREKTIRETVGKFFFDLAKTAFTAMVVGGAVALITGMENALSYAFLLGTGLVAMILLASIGYYILKHK